MKCVCVCVLQAAPGQGRCGYCDEQNVPLRRLNSTELLDMMLAHDARYTRRTVFCNVCTEKILAKYRRQKTRRRLKERKAQSSIDDPTTSYSNASLNPSKVTYVILHHFDSFRFYALNLIY